MRISVNKECGAFVTRIWFKHRASVVPPILVYEQYGHSTRAEAALDAWTNALFIRDIAMATEKSVEALVDGD